VEAGLWVIGYGLARSGWGFGLVVCSAGGACSSNGSVTGRCLHWEGPQTGGRWQLAEAKGFFPAANGCRHIPIYAQKDSTEATLPHRSTHCPPAVPARTAPARLDVQRRRRV